MELQQELFAVAGAPDYRATYEANLKEDERYFEYLKTDPRSKMNQPDEDNRKANIASWEERVKWRRELLEGLP